MSYQIKNKDQAELFEAWGFNWVNTAIFDDTEDGAGHWFNGTHKIVPIDQLNGYWKFDIYHTGNILEIEYGTDGSKKAKIGYFNSPYLIYSGEIELQDKAWFETLLVNLAIIEELDEPQQEV